MTAKVIDTRWEEAQEAEAGHWAFDNIKWFFQMLYDYRDYLDQLGAEKTSLLYSFLARFRQIKFCMFLVIFQ